MFITFEYFWLSLRYSVTVGHPVGWLHRVYVDCTADVSEIHTLSIFLSLGCGQSKDLRNLWNAANIYTVLLSRNTNNIHSFCLKHFHYLLYSQRYNIIHVCVCSCICAWGNFMLKLYTVQIKYHYWRLRTLKPLFPQFGFNKGLIWNFITSYIVSTPNSWSRDIETYSECL
jgi:hypothetical protein